MSAERSASPAKVVPRVRFRDLKQMRYQEAWDLQERLLGENVRIKTENRRHPERTPESTQNHLFFVEHPPVYTLGKSGNLENLLLNEAEMKARDIEFFKINRGGDITFHGPGQIVGYPILDLEMFRPDINWYLRNLEEACILTLAEYGIAGGRIEKLTGVWLDTESADPRKIMAIGVRCSRWVTMHGFAFNVNTDLDYFRHIIPCGIDDKGVTSLAQELGHPVDYGEVKGRMRQHLADLFGYREDVYEAV
ncbi:MAG: lipoyl(octanoyl) transferase LipB [Bacteroidota bacterium]